MPLSNFEKNEAYLAAKEGEKYLLFFPEGGKAKLDLRNFNSPFNLKWIDVDSAEWGKEDVVNGGTFIDLETRDEKPCLVLILI